MAMNHVVPEDVRLAAQDAYSSAMRRTDWARRADPVTEDGGWYYITRREEFLEALRNPVLSSRRRSFTSNGYVVEKLPLSYEGDTHARYRKILQPYFTPRAMADLQPALRSQATTLIDAVLKRGECDFIRDIAIPFSTSTLMILLGLPLDDLDELMAILEPHLNTLGEPDTPAAAELFKYFTGLMTTGRVKSGILSGLLDDDSLTDVELLGFFVLLMEAGNDTVTAAAGSALLALAHHPELAILLREDLEQIPAFVEEVVRLAPPVDFIPRRTIAAPVTVGGVTIPVNKTVSICAATVNRLESGDEINITDGKIKRQRHWSFGAGHHRCLGMHLARLELAVVIEEWLKKIPNFIVGPDYTQNVALRGGVFIMDSLPLRWYGQVNPLRRNP
jgi:cytochrome P450